MVGFGCIFFLVFGVLSCSKNVQKSNDAIGFPEIEENPLMANKQNRQPVYIPSICPENELLYPGDQADDWIFDCRPGHLYHPTTDKCWPAYREGPCGSGQYIVLPDNSSVPVCVRNPCLVEGFVVWNGKCEVLGNSCGEKFPISLLSIDAVTLKVACVRLDEVESRFSLNVQSTCLAGSKRNIKSKC
ncbi:uncharacterized protein LOC116773308 [Danaus plexippus]|uniref:uncharacterized protein LOC116773308 n=1 Tax=Danaus plexippus TaxID=13037 RepID=UPI002AB211EE|nr:uncharacterized protein LOC116773308 [Danaus plexippus]